MNTILLNKSINFTENLSEPKLLEGKAYKLAPQIRHHSPLKGPVVECRYTATASRTVSHSQSQP